MLPKVFLVISIVLYFTAPPGYSYAFCVTNLILFFFSTYYFYRKGGKFISFTTFFAISFFFVNFAYPVFIFPFDPYFILQFKYHFNESYINKGCSLSLIAFEAYLMGLNIGDLHKKIKTRVYKVKNGNIAIIKYF